MTIYFAGGEMGAFIPADGNAYESAVSGEYEETLSRCCLSPHGEASYVESASFTSLDELWVHFALTDGTGNSIGSHGVMVLTNASGTNLFALAWGDDATLQMSYWNGSAFIECGAAVPIDLTTSTNHIDLHVDGDSASGTCTLYIAGTERATATVDLSLVKDITKIRTYGAFTVSGTALSQVIVADEPTIGWRLQTIPATGAGFSTAWTGTYAEIDEVTYSDADFINTSSNDTDELFSHGTSIPSGYSVRGISVTARAKKGASGPTNLQLALRSSGTTYYSASQALGLGYGAHCAIWEDDPATTADFTTSAVTALQFGVRSKA